MIVRKGEKEKKGKQITAFDNSLFSSVLLCLDIKFLELLLNHFSNVDILTHESRARKRRKARKKNVDTEQELIRASQISGSRLETVIFSLI